MSIAVDPDMLPLLHALRAAPAVDLSALPIHEARAAFDAQQLPWVWSDATPMHSLDLEVPGAAGPMAARLYLPSPEPDQPAILFIHGGGWTFGSIDTHDGTMRLLAARSGCAVLGIDYRLAPECPFPGPMRDVLAALAWMRAGGLGDAVDPERIALAGDSAGANLALGALLTLRDEGGPLPATAALMYGCYAPLFDTPSHQRLGDGRFLMRTAMMRWYWRNFLGGEEAIPAATPMDAKLDGLPPLYLIAAGLDPLLDDTTMLAARLAAAGVRHRVDIWPGVPHGFLRFARDLPMARQALAEAGRWLGEVLTPKEGGHDAARKPKEERP